MLKRSLSLLALLLVMIPMAAFAGNLATRVMSTGGSISVAGGAAQTSANGTVSKVYTGDVPVAMTATAGYALSALTVDGVAKPLTSPYTVTMGTTNHTVAVSFAKVLIPVTAKATTTDGNVSPAGTSNIYAGTVATYSFIPAIGKRVETIEGLPAGATVTPALPYAGTVKATFTVPNSGSVNILASFVTLSATASAPQTVLVSNGTASATVSATITGTATSYTWSQISGPAPATIAQGTLTPAVTLPAAGIYKLKLTAVNGDLSAVAYTTLTATTSVADAAQAQCLNCHATNSVGPTVSAAWNASAHAQNPASICAGCHVGANTGSHPAPSVACSNCHSAQNSEFTASIHNLSPTGHESDADFVAAGHGSVASCAAKCHFNQGASKGCAVCHSGALGVGAGNGVGGGNAGVIAASEVHAAQAATVDNTCYACHSGGKHGWSPRAFEKSSHFTGDHAKLYYQFDVKKCLNCHDSHSTEATFGDGTEAGGGCVKCHHPGTYGIINADGTGKAPHTGGKPSYGSYSTGNSRTQYLSQGATCADCHGHNNTINAGYAEGGHGKVTDYALNAFTHYDWSGRTNNGTRQNGNCDRCHTSGGFVKFLGNDTATATRLAPQSGVQNVLVCVSCHKAIEGEGLESAPLRTDATPAGNPTALTGGYFALFSSAGTAVPVGKTKIEIAFPGYKNSSICIPCHSGRSTADVFVAVIDQAKATSKNYTTIQTSYYQHAANMGQTFLGKGAYDFTGARVAAANSHANVKNGTTDTQGPCVGCHYNTAGKTHSLEVANFDVCASCHLAGFGSADLAAAEEKFAAGVKVLDALVRTKFAPLQTKVGDLAEERVNVRFGQFGPRTNSSGVPLTGQALIDQVALNAKKAYGAWYNWQILVAYDKAAFAHNPGYARQILFDTIDYLDDASINNSAEATIAASTAVTDAEKTAAAEYFQAPCATCHATQTEKVQEGKHAYEVSTHSGTCGRCHTTEGYVAFLATSQDPTGTYSTSYNGGTNVSCGACHDSHGTVRAIAGFAPKYTDNLAAASEQFKLCTSCHNLVNASGQVVASGLLVNGTQTVAKQQHAKDWYRNIASTHYDLPSTGTVTNVGTLIEGYNVRFNKESACTDCHGHEFYTNTNKALEAPSALDLEKGKATVHTEWAQSGHAGKILTPKFQVFTTANAARSRTTTGAAAVMAAGVTSKTGLAWEHYNWDDSTKLLNPASTTDRQDCQRCHTATGAANYLDNPATYSAANNDFSHLAQWATAKVSPQSEVLYCWGCHSNAGTGALRTPGAIPSEYKKDGAAFSFADKGASNVCFACHAGRASGDNIVALTTAGNTFTSVSFVNSHYMAAAGLMYAKVGYTNFVPASTVIGTSTYGASLTATDDGGALSSTHRKLGTAAIIGDHGITAEMGLDVNGPCVACHYAKGNHELEIGKVAFEEVCIKCHTAEGTTTLTAENFKEVFVEEQAVPFQDALSLALAQLQANFNIRYDINAYPYFYDKNLEAQGKTGSAAAVKDWTRGGALTKAQAENLMGACFNINVLKRDPAAYAHARTYARRLLYDSIDFLDDKTINLSTGATALASDAVKYVNSGNGLTSSESYKYLRGYNRTTGVWNAIERP